MKKPFNKILSLALVLAIALSLSLTFVFDSSAASQPTKYSSTSNSGTRDVVATTLNGTSAASYYTGQYTYDNLSGQSSSALLSSLKTLMTSTHKTTTSYSTCRDKAPVTDCENENGKITMLYSSYQATYSQYDSGNGWNREHVWPQSLGGGNTSGGGADLHHIRPDENKTNGDRGNKKFGNVSSGSTSYGNLSGDEGGKYSGNIFEPNDNAKGDVARIVLYVYVRWGSSWGADSVTEVFQSVDVLLEWCLLDPVDTWELGRNEVVQKIQGNRNVFIDYPEYAWLLFGKSVPANLTSPSAGVSDTPACQHSNTVLKNAVSVQCLKPGYSGDLYCMSCNTVIEKGTTIPKTGHKFGNWVVEVEPTADDPGSQHRTCTVCNYTEREEIPVGGSGSGNTGTGSEGSGTGSGTGSGSGGGNICLHENFIYKNNVVAGCKNKGYTGDKHCADCDILIEKGVETPEYHAYGAWVVKVEPTDKMLGLKERSCSKCGIKDSEYIDLLTDETDTKNPSEKPDNSSIYYIVTAACVVVVAGILIGKVIYDRRKLRSMRK